MTTSLLYWCRLYDRLKHKALCLDIETARYNGPIAVIGLYRPADGEIDYKSFIRGTNLTATHLQPLFSQAKMLITYNGLRFDMIRKEFPDLIPRDLPVLDLYRFAQRLHLNTDLKTVERTTGIWRADQRSEQRGQAIRLWTRYQEQGDIQALQHLLDYNREDTINLYPLATKLTQKAYRVHGM